MAFMRFPPNSKACRLQWDDFQGGIQQEKAVHDPRKFLLDELGDANIPYLPVAHENSLQGARAGWG
jgi:hypothetical protein